MIQKWCFCTQVGVHIWTFVRTHETHDNPPTESLSRFLELSVQLHFHKIWNEKARDKDKTNIWLSVWWKTNGHTGGKRTQNSETDFKTNDETNKFFICKIVLSEQLLRTIGLTVLPIVRNVSGMSGGWWNLTHTRWSQWGKRVPGNEESETYRPGTKTETIIHTINVKVNPRRRHVCRNMLCTQLFISY